MEELPVLEAPVIEQTTPEQTPLEPIKDVQTFWNRLDEVLTLVKTGGGAVNEKINEILESFPDKENINQSAYRSFIFQPERLFLTSNNDVQSATAVSYKTTTTEGHQPAETFSTFRIRLPRGLVNIKSVQLLSSVIPNAIQNLPDNQLIFFYYRLRSLNEADLGAWTPGQTYNPGDIVTYNGNQYTLTAIDVAAAPSPPNLNPSYLLIELGGVDFTRPNYYDINSYNVQGIFLNPTFGLPPEDTGQYNLYNRTFQDYDDLIGALNACANSPSTASIPGDISFQYNAQLNKIQFLGSQVNTGNYYYLPCGYEDPNIAEAMENPNNALQYLVQGYGLGDMFTPGYNLNLRLGFTWNGLYPDPYVTNPYANQSLPQILYFYLRKKDPGLTPIPVQWNQPLLTANSYGDLVNTSCVRIYCDFTLGSTQDSDGTGGLLSVVPINASNLGVGFYQNNFSNPLTKIPKILTEIGIRLLNDQGLPYILPNSATVSLELAIDYY